MRKLVSGQIGVLPGEKLQLSAQGNLALEGHAGGENALHWDAPQTPGSSIFLHHDGPVTLSSIDHNESITIGAAGLVGTLQLVVEPEPDRYFCSRDKHHRVSRGDKTCPRCGSPVRKTATEPW